MMKTKSDLTPQSRSKASARQVQSASKTSRRDSETKLQPLIALVASLRDVQEQKAAHYIPIAEHLIESRSRNTQEIEHTLDHLLDVACLPNGLAAFKSLCRHYWNINPQGTAAYVYAYREMWDSADHETKDADHEPAAARSKLKSRRAMHT
jgi:hypothetical protein